MTSTVKYFDRRILFFIIVFEALLFYSFYRREIAWYPPKNFDQAAYLTQAYGLQERISSRGLGELWKAVWNKGHFSTLGLPIEGALLGLALGGTRFPQLCVNFIGFCALQAMAFATARAVWNRRAHGYLVLGLILCQQTLWFQAGGLFDFRNDFLAYCLYGIWTCGVIRSELFLSRRWAIVTGLLGAFLVLNRFLSIVYVLGVSAGFAGVCFIIGILARPDADLAGRMRRRLTNLLLALGVLILVAGPFLVINFKAIYGYYVTAHIFIEKDLRAREFGVFDLAGHLLYYPRSILMDHLGPPFLLASAISIAGAFVARLLVKSKCFASKPITRCKEKFLLEVIFLLGAVLGPVVVLTVDISKSPVVGGIVGVPSALLVVALVARLTTNSDGLEYLITRKVVLACGVLIFVFGLSNQFRLATRHSPEYSQRRDLERTAELSKWIVNYANEHNWKRPGISTDVISQWLLAYAISASGYEQTRQFIELRQMLGGSLMGVDRPEALSLLAHSDFVILTTQQKVGLYPFYENIRKYWNDLKAWADENMYPARTVPFDNFTATIYVRPTATVSGLSGGWITSYGLSVDAPRAALRRFPIIRLCGSCDYSRLQKILTVAATIETEGDYLAVPASLRRSDDSYEIRIDTSSITLPLSDRIHTHVSFDSFFVPKNLGINDDTRELVAPAPNEVELIQATP